MDTNEDEVRRQVRETQRDHEAAMPLFDRALDHAFDPANGVSEADKARLLGVPDRRNFLKIGGMSIGLAALAAACVYPDKTTPQIAETGTFSPAPSTSVPPFPGSATLDATLVLTALSLEKLAVQTYQTIITAGYLTQPVYQDVAKYFQGQHADHAASLSSIATSLGQDPSKVGPNDYLSTKVVQPALDTLKGESSDKPTTQTDTLKLGSALEDAAAQTYAQAGGLLTTAVLRQSLVAIGAIESKHFSVYAGALQNVQVPFAFQHTNGGAPTDAYIAPNGPITTTGTTPGGGTTGSVPATAAPGTLAP